MKRFNELTEAELLELTGDQIANLIDYECALEGIPMLPPPPVNAPVKVTHPFDAKVFEVGGVLVLDAERAAHILDALTSGPLFKMEYNSEYLKPLNEGDYSYPEIKTKSAHSPEQWASIAASVKEYEAAQKEYDRIAKAYNDAVKDRQGVIDTVHDAISDARRRSYTRDTLRAEFARYLELAEGNRTIAYNFLDKAKGHVLEDFPELKAEFCGVDEALQADTCDVESNTCAEVVF